MLTKFKQAKTREIEFLTQLKAKGQFPGPYSGQKKSLAKALAEPGFSLIAEYKRSSPSLGAINLEAGLEQTLQAYKRGGARAISILTEENYFGGSIQFLERAEFIGLPLLRKDFIFHPLQVEFTQSTPASAILLIVRFVDDFSLLKELYALSMESGLEPVLEIFSGEDLEQAKELGARIIQVNSRDLDTLKINLNKLEDLIRFKQDSELWIAASGLQKKAQLQNLAQLGYDGFLIGTFLMQQPDPAKTLKELS